MITRSGGEEAREMMNEKISLGGVPVVGFGDDATSVAKSSKPALLGALAGATVGALVGTLVKKGAGTLVGALIGGVGGGVIGSITTAEAAQAHMEPGQTWTATGAIHPIKAWSENSKRDVENAVETALVPFGLTLLDGKWTADYTFLVGVVPRRATNLPSTLPLASEWADRVDFSNIAQAPILAPVALRSWNRLSAGDPVIEGQSVAVTLMAPGGAAMPPDVVASLSNAIVNAERSKPIQAYPPGSQLPQDWPQADNFGPGAYRILITSGISEPFYPGDITKVIPVPLTLTAWVK